MAGRLQRLATALDAERDSFSTKDFPWLAKTTERIIRLANSTPPEDAVGLAAHCESLLAMTQTTARGTPIEVVPAASSAIELAPDGIFSPPSRSALQSILPAEDAAKDERSRRCRKQRSQIQSFHAPGSAPLVAPGA